MSESLYPLILIYAYPHLYGLIVCSHSPSSFYYTYLLPQTVTYCPYFLFYPYLLLIWHDNAPLMFDSFLFHCLS